MYSESEIDQLQKNKNTSNKRYLGQHNYARVKYAFKFVYASRFP
jgi:hypothetical protein